MPATIKLCLYGTPRNAIPSLTGRSGTIYSRAHWNDKTMRHETVEFPLDEFQGKMRDDLVKFPSQLRWWPLVTVPDMGDDVKQLTEQLAAAKAEADKLRGELKAAATAPRLDGNIFAAAPEKATDSALPEKFRDLRALAIERGVMPAGIPTKADLIALLTPQPEPVAETVAEAVADTVT